MKKIFLTLIVFTCTFMVTFAYTLTNKDNQILDRIEDKLIVLIDDESNKLTAELVVRYIDRLFERARMTQRTKTLLEVIQDDIEYIYYLGEYSDDIVYQEMSPDDCYEDEYYDEIDRLCYFNEEVYDESDEQSYAFNNENKTHNDSQRDSEILAEYSIDGDIVTLESGKSNSKNIEVWNIFTTLIPLSTRSDFLKYKVMDDSGSDSGAYVEQDSEDSKKWNITVNLDSFYDGGVLDTQYVYSTLIHEFAHVLTLNKSQMRYYPMTDNENILSRFDENCQGNLLQEGCLNTDAYLDDFIDLFWSDSEYLEKVRNAEINAYVGNESKFVNDYAATNPGEDIAESFAYFVTQTKPNSNTIADKKILFFYNYKPLDTLRKQIRVRLEQIK